MNKGDETATETDPKHFKFNDKLVSQIEATVAYAEAPLRLARRISRMTGSLTCSGSGKKWTETEVFTEHAGDQV